MCLLCYDGECDHADHVVRTLESVNNPVKTGPAFLLPCLHSIGKPILTSVLSHNTIDTEGDPDFDKAMGAWIR